MNSPDTLASPPRRWRRRALEFLLILGVIFGAQWWQAKDLPSGPAPALAGTLADGQAASLAGMLATTAGRPVLVAFWASWCPVCKAEEGNVAAVARDWPVLTVAMQSGGAAEVGKHLVARGLEFPALVDADGALAGAWRVSAVPTHFVIDGQGRVRFRIVGYATESGLRTRLWWAQHVPA